MRQPPPAAEVRRASGLAHPDTIRDPLRVAWVRRIVAGTAGSPLLAPLVRLAGSVSGAECAQLSLLADEQVATAVRCADAAYAEQTSALEDSLCTITVLSGDVLVAADARRHPWLSDLAPVVSGVVGAYLGVPLLLGDGVAVGALCVYGALPREWDGREVGLTCEVADLVALELRRVVDA